MIPLRVSRAIWEFDELAAAWRIKDERRRDLARLIESGDLRPFSAVHCDLQPLTVLDGQAMPLGEPIRYRGRLYAAQELAQQVGNLEYAYGVLRTTPAPDDPDALYFAPPAPFTTADLLENFAVTDENRREVEDKAKQSASAEECDGELSKAKEKTRDILIVVMAQELYGWEPGSERSTGATELIHLAKQYGYSLSHPTVRAHLQLACKRCPPKLSAQGDKFSRFTPSLQPVPTD